jgi:hypothetical protein
MIETGYEADAFGKLLVAIPASGARIQVDKAGRALQTHVELSDLP